MISETSTLTDVAFEVCTALDAVGITAVLTGGSAATVHAPDALQSYDLDFVITMSSAAHVGDGEAALLQLGYQRKGDYYVHPGCSFPLEFVRGPLMVGDERITAWTTKRRGELVLHLLSPTDSCRDRLAALLFWNDYSGLEQALEVCRVCGGDVDLAVVRDWCLRERQPEKWQLFRARLKQMS